MYLEVIKLETQDKRDARSLKAAREGIGTTLRFALLRLSEPSGKRRWPGMVIGSSAVVGFTLIRNWPSIDALIQSLGGR